MAEKGVSLQTQLAETLPPICGDRIHLQQMINAGKAISAVGVGLRELLISTTETDSNVTRFAVRVRGQASLPRVPTASSMLTTRRNPVVCGSGYRSARRSSKRMADD